MQPNMNKRGKNEASSKMSYWIWLLIGGVLGGVLSFIILVYLIYYSINSVKQCMNDRKCRNKGKCKLKMRDEPEFADIANSDDTSKFEDIFDGLFSELNLPTADDGIKIMAQNDHQNRMYKFGYLWVCNAADGVSRDIIDDEGYTYNGDIPDEEACLGGCKQMYTDLSKSFIQGMNSASDDGQGG